MLIKHILCFFQPAVLACDGNCGKAWGINNRPSRQLSDDPDDFAWLADWELGTAPVDPGTYEGGHGKPIDYTDPLRQNKWCARECERSVIEPPGVEITLRDFSRPVPNMRKEA
jgi:hypothetical protein